ncbi:hypothetical protein BCR42DRAFT_130267 [Absidia repens]|uniref:Uncharacterized protein n=1 Tax=Absidia repens TaxID=90262 RepID=A0A1X2IVQ2_9FUNG|nr:hypothetical protein BCR42DRAFT_130267 [Absidia repens]
MSQSYDCSSKHARLTKSKATESTTAIQPLEITTTAVVNSSSSGSGGSGSSNNSNTNINNNNTNTNTSNNNSNNNDKSNSSSNCEERVPILSSNKSRLQTFVRTSSTSSSSSSDLKQLNDKNTNCTSNSGPSLQKVDKSSKPTQHTNSESIDKPDIHRKKSRHHHHHHFIKSPVFNHGGEPLPTSVVAESVVSPLMSPMASATLSATVTTLDTIFPGLPPPVDNGPSEAMVALYDAANESVKSKSNRTTTDTMTQLFDSCFFSAILLVQWSNVVGPKVSKAWSGEPMDAQLLTTIARQVLNGEMGRTLSDTEPKWLILHRQGLVCTAFLYQDPCSLLLCALVMVVPVRYLRNFTQYFKVLSQRVPHQLIDVLVKLRKIYRRLNISWSIALDYFANIHLFPLIQSIMDLESVSLPTEWPKVNREKKL